MTSPRPGSAAHAARTARCRGSRCRCADCGGLEIDVTAGEELLVDSLEVEDQFEEALTTTKMEA